MASNSILTVITDALSRDLTTLATVKDELGITDGTSNARLSRWIHEASGLIESYCDQVFAQQTVQETFRQFHIPHSTFHLLRNHGQPTPRSGPLVLRRHPVASIVSVVEDDAFEDDGTTPLTLVEGLDFEVDAETGLLWRLLNDHPSYWVAQKTVVTYTGGYALIGDLPYPIEQACITMVKHRWSARDRDPMLRQQSIPGVIEQQFWVGATGTSGALPPEVEDMLCRFREIRT